MQTFLPYADINSVSMLDRQRLGKQRVEALQIVNTLLGHSTGWRNHPAVKMWHGHAGFLTQYGIACCTAWINRGYADSLMDRFVYLQKNLPTEQSFDRPFWFGDKAFHASHRANLLRKNPEFYASYGWIDDPSMPYVWPVP